MSWLSDFAGKAEDLLNKIDHNAAVVLKKEKKKKTNQQSVVTVESNEHLSNNKIYTPNETSLTINKVSPMHNDKVVLNTNNKINVDKDDKLIQYLNNSSYDIDTLQLSVNNDNPVQSTGTTSITLSDDTTITGLESEDRLINENEMLKNEVRSLNSEVSLLMSRVKVAEKEMFTLKSSLNKKEMEVLNHEKELNNIKHRYMKTDEENSELIAENERLKMMNKSKEIDERSLLVEAETKLSQCQLDAQQREESLKGDIAALRIRITELETTLCENRKQHAVELAELGNRLTEARNELSEYMIKTTNRLAYKERVVEELRNTATNEEILSLDVKNLQSEIEWLTEECERLRNKLETSRIDIENAERKLEKYREEYAINLSTLQTRYAQEHARRMAAEENCTSHTQELQSVREELTRQLMSMTDRVRERETELSRLRRQLAQKVANNSANKNHEQRIAALTNALVEKELALEQMTDQRNQLRIQFDRIKNDYGNTTNTYPTNRNNILTQSSNVNDTDDAKAQVPLLMSEGPHDTLVTRRVKRAYTCVDSLGMRTGLLLRRYPLARLLSLLYIIFLHLWVCLVLFSYTPDTKV